MHVSTALGSVKTRELYPLGFFHHRCFLRVPPRNSTWNGTFQSGYPAAGLFIETGGQRFQAFEIDNRWRGRGWPPRGGVEMDEKGKRGDFVGEELCYAYVKGEQPLDIGGAVQFNLCYSCSKFDSWTIIHRYSFVSCSTRSCARSFQFYHFIRPLNRIESN